MVTFSHVNIVLSGRSALDRSISDLELRTTSAGTYLVSTSGANGGLVSYAIGSDGALGVVDSHFFTGAQTRLDSSEVSIFAIDGANYVVTGSIGNQTLRGQRLLDNGNLGATTGFDGFSGDSGAMSAMAEMDLSGGHFIFTASRDGDSLDVYRVGANASYLANSSFQDSDQSYASGVVDMANATVGGMTYLLTLSGTENGVSCFRVGATNGNLTLTSSYGADQGLGIYTPTDLETVTAYGATYAIVASAGTSSLSVLKLDAEGGLQRTDHILDTLHTRFGGVTAVETVKIGGQVYVVAGGADDGLSLFILLPGGRLQYLETIAQTTTNGLGDIQDIAVAQVGSDIQIYVASGQTRGISHFTVDLPTLGANLIGRDGDQVLSGTSASEILSGGRGDDTLSGGSRSDFLHDGKGSDTLIGGRGGDVFVLSADGETDRILDYQPYYDWIDLSAFAMLYSHTQVEFTQTATGAIVRYRDEVIEITHGDSKPLAFHQVFWKTFSGPHRPAWDIVVTHEGTDGDDRITGSYLADIMNGRNGNDTLIGDAGSDTLRGGNGNDTLNGGYSGDRLFGDGGDDLIWGGEGNDRVNGGAGKDVARLEGGNDTASLGDDDDEAFGGTGNDEIHGDAGNDQISGEAGDDTLYGEEGNDTLLGGAGGDRIEGGEGDDTVYGGTGRDTVIGDIGNDRIFGEDDNDSLSGNGGHDLVYGGSGNDTLNLGEGDDEGLGGEGNDLIIGGPGIDRLVGDDGDDTLQDSDGQTTALGGGGNDTITLGDGNDLANGGVGNDRISGGGGADQLFGGFGDDWIGGGDHDDTIEGEDGNDILIGGLGNDILRAGAGNDRVFGGKGNDVVDLGDGNDTFIDAKANEPDAQDRVAGGDGDDRIIGKAGADIYWGNKGNDTILGGKGGDTIKGGMHADILKGRNGKDTIYGDAGGDQLAGGLHADILFGGRGNDRIAGNKGQDILSGGPGKDVFVFYRKGGSDSVRDFANGIDKLHIDVNRMSFRKLKVTPVDGGTKIDYGAGEFLLEGISHWKIGAEDFIFG